MRPVIFSMLSLATLAATLPAQAQTASGCGGMINALRNLEDESTRLRQAGATARDEEAERDRYAALNREIAELNESPVLNEAPLVRLRAERAEVLAGLNQTIIRRQKLGRNEAAIEAAKNRLAALHCPPPTLHPWERGSAAQPQARQPARRPWEREVTTPIPRALPLPSSASLHSGPSQPEPAARPEQPAGNPGRDGWIELPTPSIAGKWRSTNGFTFDLKSDGKEFTWSAPGHSGGNGEIHGSDVIAQYNGNGQGALIEGKLIRDSAGNVVEIRWNNGWVFSR